MSEERVTDKWQAFDNDTQRWIASMEEADALRDTIESLTTAVEHAEKLYWFFLMVENGGPDGSDLDAAVWEDARAAAALHLQRPTDNKE